MKTNHRAILWAAVVSLVIGLTPVWAGPGHDHGAPEAPSTGNTTKRQADGSVFLPKGAQRQISVRTVAVEEGDLARSVELAGKVVMDPNSSGKVQAVLAGRIEAGSKGLPNLGQSVKKGEVLAYVVASSGVIERSNQAAQIAELRAAKSLAEKRLSRLQELVDTVPRKDIEAAASEVSSVTQRIAALNAGLNNRDALVAPVSGVIALSNIVVGQVVEARELIFEVIDPTQLRIEALAYDAALIGNIAGATLVVGNERVSLVFVGAAQNLREQALPMIFRADANQSNQRGALTKLAIGQPVKLFVQSKGRVKGIQVQAASLMRNSSNQTIVWVKTSPERFEPRLVTTEPLDGASVAVTSGLKSGERVVTQAAPLINQIR